MTRQATWWLTGILAAGLLLRLGALPFDPLEHDDGFTIACATAPTWGESLRLTLDDTHPPLYYFLIRLLFFVTPAELWVARAFSILLSVATILLTHRLARHFFDERVALTAAALLAFTPFNIFWAHMARNHQLLAPLGALSFLLLFRYLRDRRRGDLWGYCLALTLVMQTNYMGVMLFATQSAIIVFCAARAGGGFRDGGRGGSVRLAWPPLAVQVVSFLLFLPWKFALARHMAEGPMPRRFFESSISPITPIFHALFGRMEFQPGVIPLYVLLPGLVLFTIVLCANLLRQRHHEIYLFLFLPVLLPVVIAKVFGFSLAIRHFAYSVPATMVFTAFGLVATLDYLRGISAEHGEG